MDFEVQPRLLTAYADALRAGAAELAAVAEALGRVRIERRWFGHLPQSGLLADRYDAHREAELAAIGELRAWLAAASEGLDGSAGRYSGADREVAELAGTVEAGLGVGIETRTDGAEAPTGIAGPGGVTG